MENAKTVDVYTRVSRVGDREHLTSPEDQERDARAFAASRGLAVGEVFADLNESGGTIDRPEFAKVLRRIEGGESSGVVVAYLSRASRDTAQGLALLDRITAAGGAVYAPNLPDYTTADGRMLATIQLAIDTGYLQRKASEFERAKAGAIAAGIPVANRSPVGYRRGADRRLEPDPDTASVVRELFERRAQGAGPTELGRILEAAGVRTSAGSASWSVSAVTQLLRNRVYLGELSYGKPPRYTNATAHEPIVDFPTWTAAQHPHGEMLRPGRSDSGEFVLSGILRCAACGYAMEPTRTSADRGARRVYRCKRRHAGGLCTEAAYTRAEPVEQVVGDTYRAILEAALQMRHPDGTLTVAAKPAPALDALTDALALAESRLAAVQAPEMFDAAGAGWAGMVKMATEARDAAALALGQARAEQGSAATAYSIEQAVALWDHADPTTRRSLIARELPIVALDRDGRVWMFPASQPLPEVPRRGTRLAPALRPILPGARTIPGQV
jgi:DNA invertase Pin-like site-specific DNA recombinase